MSEIATDRPTTPAVDPRDRLVDRPTRADTPPPTVPAGRWKRRSHHWFRWLHVYISMFSLLIMIFFGLTGITLNHPSWTFGDETSLETLRGSLPSTSVVDGEVELLAVSEYIRAEHDVKGEVSDFAVAGTSGTISYKAPGYGAELIFDTADLDYSVTIQQQGFVAVMNDLHKGRDADTGWRWVIDASGALLVAIGLTGLGIQFFLRKRRFSALTVSAVGGVATIVLIVVAMA